VGVIVVDLASWRPGTRVVVRRRLPDGSATDVVGTLLATRPDAVRIDTRRGPVDVAVADVVAARAVPPRATRRGPAHLALSVRDLEDVMADGWRALDVEWLAGPGSWLLRASEGFTGRGNSALPLADLDPPPLAQVVRWYASRGLPATVVLPEPLRDGDTAPSPGLRRALEAAGWVERTPTRVLVARARDVPPAAPPEPLAVSLAETPDDGWLGLYRYRGQQLPPVALRLLTSAPPQVFASVREAGETLAVGRLAVARGWGGITAMEVAPSARRRGLARAVLAALADAAVRLGAPSLYLQVAEDNAGARALYEAAGFVDHHRYAYFSPRSRLS
jgi:GNAT superfamily N-acetyltransferase